MKNNLSEKLKALRESKSWSKTHVAKKLNVNTLSTYANWEYGLRTPDNDMIAKIAELYDVSTDYLLGITSKPTSAHRNEEEEEFLKAISDPNLKRWFIDLSKSDQEDLEKLRTMWNLIKGEKRDDK
ncbi:transcriptional regulator with XRE-family HTH domain [Bacillus thermophilus]|uniref:XRE family transcriptional regulator n=2 Tax=Siminovitchia TaxID=2837510 RepID=A0A429X2E2_SIMTE|nr:MULTISPECIES: helix-turn-helix transcriptional regulator [Siminovitchia]MBM7715990.1 transcriptional regulator with XRE-family HTH domain [Siminovitchia thermophila]RST57358.1 XRE family transcriptional regulator [Siminovitchia terrae]